MADRRQVLRMGAVAAAAPALAGTVAAPALAHGGGRAKPEVFGHRGASGYRPEHTLASYELAARMGADYIEPDLVATKDHVLVCRHEPEIGGTTDVAGRPEFAARKKTVSLDGVSVTGWFTEDFTLAELKSLRAVERLPAVRQENTLYDGLFEVPTFREVLELRAKLSQELGRDIGVIPETKHPTYFRRLGLELETPLVRELRRARLDKRGAKVWIQSFEAANLKVLHQQYKVQVNLVFLTSAAGSPFNDTKTYAQYLTPAGLKELSSYVDGIGPEKNQIIPRNADATLGTPTSLVKDAHAAGLKVIPYTFRAENQFLPAELRVGTDPTAYGKAIDEQITFLRTGIDGLFTDQPDIGVLSRTLL
ncbi:glycerophosphoryl diester phosphodiesterase [Paractinoplanes abujensis]|uniref:glycerophosphodiester phosphodiesterase n=1 Tax=Paractinoplanes abujensis TaxID=882441 RepID=A0A7W7CKL1_9ACTN|nr:glycerophosphodiester phosphodiesterase [Actinoplanes abujensis]MBB4690240.1 glycerophosphoryl diester phosphodiesterase [Actinoplanes abujensis]GID21003.1 glycerophosphoryl diester phosphodiesterase [Actinoplanes abujensis]